MGESFGEIYGELMRSVYGEDRVHVSTAPKPPRDVFVGEYVMYLPPEIAETFELPPQVARVEQKLFEHGEYRIVTDKGIMVFREGETIEVVA